MAASRQPGAQDQEKHILLLLYVQYLLWPDGAHSMRPLPSLPSGQHEAHLSILPVIKPLLLAPRVVKKSPRQSDESDS